tara:strand:- start:1368 stop:1529 length:162 start_codon:yes stop_codon:yes gene_type:complete
VERFIAPEPEHEIKNNTKNEKNNLIILIPFKINCYNTKTKILVPVRIEKRNRT